MRKLADMIDITFLTKMMDGDENLAKKFVEIFKNQAPQQMQELRSQVERNDWEAVSTTSHSLKSQFSYLNLISLADQMAQIELLADENRGGEIDGLLVNVEFQFSTLFASPSVAAGGFKP